jgi:exonuclease SbcD
MARLQARFPHTLSLSFAPEGTAGDELDYAARVRGRSDLDVCCGFVEHVRGVPADDGERAVLGRALEQASAGDQDAA